MSIKGQLTKEDYAAFQKLHMKQPILVSCFFVYIYIIFFLFLISAILSGFKDINNYIYFLPLALIVIIYTILKYIILPNNWRKLFNQNKELNLPFEIELNEEELMFTNELSTSKRPWKNFIKWKDDTKLILLYHADNMATMLPKRLFTEEQINYIYSKIRNNNLPKSQIIGKKTIIIVIIVIVLFILFFCGFTIISFLNQ
jgi:hypothetical protein